MGVAKRVDRAVGRACGRSGDSTAERTDVDVLLGRDRIGEDGADARSDQADREGEPRQ